MKASAQFKMTDQNDNSVITNINFFNPAKMPIGFLGDAESGYDYASDAGVIETAFRGLQNLTTNTYNEVTLTYSATLSELQEG